MLSSSTREAHRRDGRRRARRVAALAALGVTGGLLIGGAASAEDFASARPPVYVEGVWRNVGPSPIPPGDPAKYQQAGATSGRVNSVVVSPTDPDTAFIGASVGGVWRTRDGGANWEPILDDAATLAVEELLLHDGTLWVGTGSDVGVGVGVYRIPAATSTPAADLVVEGPFDTRVAGSGTDAGNGLAFSGRVVRAIVADPTDPDRLFVGTADRHFASLPLVAGRPEGEPGLYVTENARDAQPVFSRVSSLGATRFVADLAFVDPATPGGPAPLIATAAYFDDQTSRFTSSAVWRLPVPGESAVATDDAPTGTAPTAVRVRTLGGSLSGYSAELAASGQTVYVSSSERVGTLWRSRDGGATFQRGVLPPAGVDPRNVAPTADTFASRLDGWGVGDHSGGIAVDPTDPDHLYLGGAFSEYCTTCGDGYRVLVSSADGGVTWRTADGPYEKSMYGPLAFVHPDTVAIAYAPSDPDVVWAGTDGGVYRTDNGRATGEQEGYPRVSATVWQSRNTPGLAITQVYEIAAHPRDLGYQIVGTQDNGAVLDSQPRADWAYVGGGDVFGVIIDSNATDTEAVTSYVGCSRYDSTTKALTGKADATVRFGGWQNCQFSPWPGYSVQGSGKPNAVFGPVANAQNSSVARSTDRGQTSTDLGPATAMAVSPRSNTTYVLGARNGDYPSAVGDALGASTTGPWGRTTRAMQPPLFGIGALAYDTASDDTLFVGLGGYRRDYAGSPSSQFWRVDGLTGSSPTYTPAKGLPDVPVSSIVVNPGVPGDSANRKAVFVGTTSGVFASFDEGATFAPFGTGLPRGCEAAETETCGIRAYARTARALTVVRPGLPESVLRFGTHGRSVWEIPLGQAPAAPTVTVTTPAEGAHYRVGQSVPAQYACADEVGGSGIASCEGPVADGAQLDTSRPGLRVFRVAGVDGAGQRTEVSHAYRLLFAFDWGPGVEPEPAVNVREAGYRVPVSFSLSGFHGDDVVSSRTSSSEADCATGVATSDDAQPAQGLLTYDATTGRYTYRWPTERAWAGSCRRLTLHLSDGTEHSALFRLYAQPPTVTVHSPRGDVLLGERVLAAYDCADEPGGSGLASCEGSVPAGDPVDTGTVGAGSLVVTAADVAGNTTTVTEPYRVVYDFDGFRKPVANPPSVNTVTAGQAVPLRFSLAGDHGLGVLTGVRSVPTSCEPTIGLVDIAPTEASGPGLTYDATTDTYQYVWRTERTWGGQCRSVEVALDDGTRHTALFHFR